MNSKQPYFYFILSFISLIGAAGILDILEFSRYCSIIMRLWSLCHLYLILKHGFLKGPIRYFTFFVFTLIAYSIGPTIHGNTYQIGLSTVTAANYLNNSWMYACPFYSFYWFTKKGLIDRSFIQWMTMFGFVYCISLFVLINSRFVDTRGSLGDANNSSYAFLQLMPLAVFFTNKKNLQYILLFLIFVAIVIASKRGALLIALICFLVFYNSNINLSRKTDRTRAIFLAILSIIIYSAFLYYEYLNNSFFNERVFSFFENDSSGRDEYYTTLWYSYIDLFSEPEKLFGKGIYGTIPIIGNYAHNDWLEYLISFGLLGCSLYFLYFLSLIFFYRKVRKFNNEQSKSLLLTIIILFMSTLFSMSYTGMTVFITFSLGYNISYFEKMISKDRVRV